MGAVWQGSGVCAGPGTASKPARMLGVPGSRNAPGPYPPTRKAADAHADSLGTAPACTPGNSGGLRPRAGWHGLWCTYWMGRGRVKPPEESRQPTPRVWAVRGVCTAQHDHALDADGAAQCTWPGSQVSLRALPPAARGTLIWLACSPSLGSLVSMRFSLPLHSPFKNDRPAPTSGAQEPPVHRQGAMLLKLLQEGWQPPCALGWCHHQELVHIDQGDEGVEWLGVLQAQVVQLDLPWKGMRCRRASGGWAGTTLAQGPGAHSTAHVCAMRDARGDSDAGLPSLARQGSRRCKGWSWSTLTAAQVEPRPTLFRDLLPGSHAGCMK